MWLCVCVNFKVRYINLNAFLCRLLIKNILFYKISYAASLHVEVE